MARLNIDYEKVRSDPRFRALSRKLGEEGRAWEMVLRFWSMAQAFWGKDRSLVPLEIFELEGDLDVLLVVHLAERRETGIYARGSEKEFTWYADRLSSASAAGKASAKARAEKYGSAVPHGASNTPPLADLVDPPLPPPPPTSSTPPPPLVDPPPPPNENRTAVRGSPNGPFEQTEPNPNALTLTLTPALTPALGAITLSPPKVVKKWASPSDLKVGREWLAFALAEMPWQAGKAGFTEEVYGEAIAKVRRATGLNDEGVEALLAFVKADDFWRKNAMSPGGLLKKSERNGQRKVDNILVRMKAEENKGTRGMLSALKEWAEQ